MIVLISKNSAIIETIVVIANDTNIFSNLYIDEFLVITATNSTELFFQDS